MTIDGFWWGLAIGLSMGLVSDVVRTLVRNSGGWASILAAGRRKP